MKLLVLGGDGFCGWPTSLHLSARGHDVAIVDNFARRAVDEELGVSSLTPIRPLHERLDAWEEVSGRRISHFNLDLTRDYEALRRLLVDYEPDAIAHFAQQPSAPYSMKTPAHKRRTVEGNLSSTHNLLCALVENGQDIPLVHLGTMGVYGYSGAWPIPEGYLKVEMPTQGGVMKPREILYPTDPGSIYHMTKSIDQLLFYYYNKNDGLRITDLHQGIVWGTNTVETSLDERLINRFSYDGEFGTVLNRFLIQAAVGYPLSVHGVGGQTRAFIHLQDTVRCIELALINPPGAERVRIFNQVSETYRVSELAQTVAKLTGAEVQFVANPRNETPVTEMKVDMVGLKSLGFTPTSFADGLMTEVIEVARRYAHRCDQSKFPAVIPWRAERTSQDAAE